MRRRFVVSDLLFVMFGSFSIAYGAVYSLRDVQIGTVIVLAGIVIFVLWGFLLTLRSSGSKSR